jgi:cytochrome c-type biogenesis protein CcmH/NrfF
MNVRDAGGSPERIEPSREPPAGATGARATAVTLLLIAAVLAAAAAIAFLALRGPVAPTSIQDRARVVAQGLLCPACEGLSGADSPSAIAGEIRRDIARRLAAGQSAAAIRSYYVSRYGPRILLSPPKAGVTLVAWLVPLLLVVGGLGVAVGALRRWTIAGARDPSQASLDDRPKQTRDDDGGLSAADRALLNRARTTMSVAEEPE